MNLRRDRCENGEPRGEVVQKLLEVRMEQDLDGFHVV